MVTLIFLAILDYLQCKLGKLHILAKMHMDAAC